MEAESGCSSRAIDSSNVGFQLLKKCGWKEGTGLGASEQGRLEPVETHVKNNKRGLGSEKEKKTPQILKNPHPKVEKKSERKKKAKVSKRMRKMQEEEKRLQETEFDRAFFRDFWPENV